METQEPSFPDICACLPRSSNATAELLYATSSSRTLGDDKSKKVSETVAGSDLANVCMDEQQVLLEKDLTRRSKAEVAFR